MSTPSPVLVVTTEDALRCIIQESITAARQTAVVGLLPSTTGELLGGLQFLTAAQVAQVCGVQADTVRGWHREGYLAARGEGRVERYHVEDVLRLVRERMQTKVGGGK